MPRCLELAGVSDGSPGVGLWDLHIVIFFCFVPFGGERRPTAEAMADFGRVILFHQMVPGIELGSEGRYCVSLPCEPSRRLQARWLMLRNKL